MVNWAYRDTWVPGLTGRIERQGGHGVNWANRETGGPGVNWAYRESGGPGVNWAYRETGGSRGQLGV